MGSWPVHLWMLAMSMAHATTDCPGDPPALVIERALDVLPDLAADLQPLVQAVEQVDGRLICMDNLVSPSDLATLRAVGAVAARLSGDDERADQWCRDSWRMSAGVPIPPSLDRARRSACPLDSDATSPIQAGLVEAASLVFINGVPLRTGHRRSLAAGDHLIQWEDGGRVHGELLTVQVDAVQTVGPSPSPDPEPVSVEAPPQVNKRELWTGLSVAAVGTAGLWGSSYGLVSRQAIARQVSDTPHHPDAAEASADLQQRRRLATSAQVGSTIVLAAGVGLALHARW